MINMLPDNVFLKIFEVSQWMEDLKYLDDTWHGLAVWRWHILVHVCHRWHHIIFVSPLCLNLRILCTNGTPVRKSLDIWPTFLIFMIYGDWNVYGHFHKLRPTNEDNVITAL